MNNTGGDNNKSEEPIIEEVEDVVTDDDVDKTERELRECRQQVLSNGNNCQNQLMKFANNRIVASSNNNKGWSLRDMCPINSVCDVIMNSQNQKTAQKELETKQVAMRHAADVQTKAYETHAKMYADHCQVLIARDENRSRIEIETIHANRDEDMERIRTEGQYRIREIETNSEREMNRQWCEVADRQTEAKERADLEKQNTARIKDQMDKEVQDTRERNAHEVAKMQAENSAKSVAYRDETDRLCALLKISLEGRRSNGARQDGGSASCVESLVVMRLIRQSGTSNSNAMAQATIFDCRQFIYEHHQAQQLFMPTINDMLRTLNANAQVNWARIGMPASRMYKIRWQGLFAGAIIQTAEQYQMLAGNGLSTRQDLDGAVEMFDQLMLPGHTYVLDFYV